MQFHKKHFLINTKHLKNTTIISPVFEIFRFKHKGAKEQVEGVIYFVILFFYSLWQVRISGQIETGRIFFLNSAYLAAF